MSTKVSITKSKLDSLANAVSVKSGTAIPLTIDEMTTAVMNISGGGSTPDLQTKSVSYAPTTSQQTAAVTADAGYDGLETVNVTISAIQTETASVTPTTSSQTITPTAGHFFDEVSVGAVSLQDDKYIAISQSGYTSFTPDNGYMGISAGDVYVPVSTPGVSTVASYSNPTEINPIGYNDQYVNVDVGFIETGKSYKVDCVPFGTEGTPTATKGAVSNHAVTVTPSVTNSAGYISGGTHTGTAVSVSASELVSGNLPITSNGNNIDCANYSTVSVNVASGSSKNAQVVQSTTRTSASTLTAIGAELTVSKTGTYDIYYSCFRTNTSTSYTWATRLYINGTAYGTAENTTWTNNQQNTHLSNISLTTGDKLRVYGRNTRGTSYYVCAPMLAIVEA